MLPLSLHEKPLTKKDGSFLLVAYPTFEAFALPLHWISNDKKAHAREICIYQLPTHTGVEVEIQSTNADTSSVALSSMQKSCEVFESRR